MEIIDLSLQIVKDSEKYAEVMSVCSTLLRHAPEAEKARVELKKRVPTFNVSGFSFGYFPDNSKLNLITNIIKQEELEELGLIYNKKTITSGGFIEMKPHALLASHNIIMPYKNVYGDIIGLVGRTLLSKEEQKKKNISKYKNTSLSKSLNLFGMYNAKKSIIEKDSVIIVEGQFDCITCHRYGIKNVVALGGSKLTKFHLYLIKRYTKNIYLLLDNDDAGRFETDKIMNRFGELANIKPIYLNSCYKDIDEYLIKNNDTKLLYV